MALNIRSPLFGEHHTLWNAESQHWDFGSSDTDSYANVAYENVIESLQDIIRKEFHIPVFDEHRGNQSIVVDFVTDNFVEQPKVINGASDTIVKIFGDAGIHTRAAVSVNSLPLGVAVEVDAIFELN